ncbi:peptidase [Rhodobacteraceae bacterium WD3A24]|nr:peptidase [Rhodobacteraceae bacterium WD3A24]
MTNESVPQPLSADELRPAVRPESLDFETTEALEPAESWLGQDRAVDAIRLATEIGHDDFNVFVMGTPGSGRRAAVRRLLEEAAAGRERPNDLVYVNNFDTPEKPTAISLPPGVADRLRRAMEELIDDLANAIPALFESEDYKTRRSAIDQEFSEGHEEAMSELFEKARERNVAIMRTPMGFSVAPARDGKVLSPEEYRQLPEDEREEIDNAIEETQQELADILGQVPDQQKEHRRRVEGLNYEMAESGVTRSIARVEAQFEEYEKVLAYLERVKRDLIENAEIFLQEQGEQNQSGFPVATSRHYQKPQFQKYTVNVLVSNDPENHDGAPVIEEDLPTLANLIGRIEYASQMGALVTNFTMIRPGALHRANGGFLVLDTRQVLTEPFAWDALKRSLRSGEITIYSPSERLSLISTVSLDPDPVALDVRVILVGERLHYYLLSAYDPDFAHHFKIAADFSDHMSVEGDAATGYARLMGGLAREAGLAPLDRGAVARMFHESMRMTGDAERLSLNVDTLSDILREAGFHGRKRGAEVIGADDIDTAMSERERRASRIRELGQEAITRDIVLIDTDGARTGQINALSVLDLGNYRFGRPSRVTARARMGAGKVVDIERETELGGPIHSKGMLILQGYLATTYATEAPMSLWASIVFEQSYGGVDGDSASAAELVALLSSLADAPLDQSFAMTGSVNQFGDVQAIGGVNEKIEGFFDICDARGLTGRQGVLIPRANVTHLALRARVAEAVEAGSFRVIPVDSVLQALSILTGEPAGTRGDDGAFPEGSLNARIEAQLQAYASARKAYGAAQAATSGGGRS